jgi:hypothetical protein
MKSDNVFVSLIGLGTIVTAIYSALQPRNHKLIAVVFECVDKDGYTRRLPGYKVDLIDIARSDLPTSPKYLATGTTDGAGVAGFYLSEDQYQYVDRVLVRLRMTIPGGWEAILKEISLYSIPPNTEYDIKLSPPASDIARCMSGVKV